MSRIRTLLVATFLMIGGTAVTAHAQQAQDTTRSTGTRRPSMTQRLLNGITLTDEQQGKIKALEDKYRAQMQELRQSGDRQKMRETMQQETDEIRAVLTEDQQKTFDANLQEMRDRMRNRSGGGGR